MLNTIRVNLATEHYVDRRWAFCIMVAVAVAILSISVTNLYRVAHYQERIEAYRSKMVKLKRANLKAAADKAVGERRMKPGEITRIKKLLVNMNGLIARDVFPWTLMLERLEQKVPSGMVIDRFIPSADYRQLTLEGRASAAHKVTFLLERFDEDAFFRKSRIVSLDLSESGRSKNSGAPYPIEFTIESQLQLADLLDPRRYGGIAEVIGANQ